LVGKLFSGNIVGLGKISDLPALITDVVIIRLYIKAIADELL
jgi:hypothetical protein